MPVVEKIQAVGERTLPSVKGRVTAIMLFCFVLAVVILGRAAMIQVLPHQKLEQMAKRQFQSKVLIRPRRGPILDRSGEPLAINSEISSLAMNPSKVQNRKTVARLLSKAIDIPYNKLIARMTDKKEFVWIKRHLTENDLNRLRKWQIIDHSGELIDGLWQVKESQRVYPHGDLSGQILGSVNLDSEGTEGIELWMNDKMRGKVISVSAIKDALGRPAFLDSSAAEAVREGKDGEPVQLTIDASLQFEVEEELQAAIHKSNAKAGTVIVMNASTGEVLALATQPSFNPNSKSSPLDHRRVRALTDGYEPGSTMKAVLLAGALSNGAKLTDTVFGEHGHFMVQGRKISEAEAHEKFDWISLKKMIQVSSNVGAAKLALKLGSDKYFDTLKNYGFGIKTGTGFPGEISGRVPPRKSWQPLTLANVGFGQGILVTPIQMLRAYATFINGGMLVQPMILRNPEQAGMKVEPPKRVISQKTADGVLEALESVTGEKGTGIKARLSGYRVAGKTGTAQKVDPANGKYSRSKYVASFIGFPLGTEQKIVIFTSIDEPHGVYYASETAAPLFREVLNAVVNRYSIPATIPSELEGKVLASATGAKGKHELVKREPVKGAPAEAVTVTQAAAVRSAGEGEEQGRSPAAAPVGVVAPELLQPAGDSNLDGVQALAGTGDAGNGQLALYGKTPSGRLLWKMPSLVGLTPREALQAMKGHQIQIEVKGTGLVHSQHPEPGKLIADGETIRLGLAE